MTFTAAISTSPAGASSVPAAVNYWKQVRQFGAYGNITSNDCSLAAIAALQQVWQAAVGGGGSALSSLGVIDSYRSAVHGADIGLLPAQAFAAWEAGIDGLKIDSVAPMSTSQTSLEQAIWQLGGVFAVVNITGNDFQSPNVPTALSSTIAPWSLNEPIIPGAFPPTPHSVAVVGYDSQYVYLATWGAIQRVTWGWWKARAVQAWALLPDNYFTQGRGSGLFYAVLGTVVFHHEHCCPRDGPIRNLTTREAGLSNRRRTSA